MRESGPARSYRVELCGCGIPCETRDTYDVAPNRQVLLYQQCGGANNCGFFRWLEHPPDPAMHAAVVVEPQRNVRQKRMLEPQEAEDPNSAHAFEYVMKRKTDLSAMGHCRCVVCLCILVEPRQTACKHNFCLFCLLQVVQEDKSCPMCRAVLNINETMDADITMVQMLRELEVYCSHRARGCDWTGPRGDLAEHCAKGCKFAAPVPKVIWETVEYVPPIHRFCMCIICLRPMQNPVTLKKCEHSFCFRCIASFLDQGTRCPACGAEAAKFDLEPADKTLRGLLAELIALCPNRPRCTWSGPRTELESHFKTCPEFLAAAEQGYAFMNVSTE